MPTTTLRRLSLLICLGCMNPASADDFYLTSVGSWWIMRTVAGPGVELEDYEKELLGIRVIDLRIVNGHKKWKVQSVSHTDGNNLLTSLVRSIWKADEEDIYEMWEYYDVGREAYYAIDDEDKTPILLIPYPVKKGSVWTDGEDRVKVIDVAKKVKVPAGEFECIAYEHVYTDDADQPDELAAGDKESVEDPDEGESDEVSIEYWSKSFGMVLIENYTIEDGKRKLRSKLELLSYKIAKPAQPQ